jgi:hypothetical protein
MIHRRNRDRSSSWLIQHKKVSIHNLLDWSNHITMRATDLPAMNGKISMSPQYDFGDRVYQLWVKEPANGGVLEGVSLRELNGRSFIVGRLAPQRAGDEDPRTGQTFWFPLDDILMITEYPNLQAARDAHKARKERKSADAAAEQKKPRKWFGS